MNPSAFTRMAMLTLQRPDRAIAMMRGLQLPMADRWAALALATVLSSILAGLANLMFPSQAGGASALLVASPIVLTVLQFFALTAAAALMARVGQMFGGHGNFPDALLALTWIDLIIIAAQAVQLALMVVLPSASTMLSLATLALYVVLAVRVTTALHGFSNPFLVALGMVSTLMLTGAVLSVVLAMLGLLPAPEALP
ncbi:YIP1 family protein [Paracoccus suum]|uniref:YIP1 family protein n=1 Tax=Paracoccus suum TaxID=2259340 RepID=A0A344PGY8_9RHOB|nr:YIP1 family protein [Paracoccus suum]AXC48643.1 YIP1 family protein [Paracoccus suum]